MSQGFPRIRSMTQEDVHFVDKSAESEVGSPADSAVSVPTLS
ncbi:phosphoserine phosphatase SerB, partial [Escherichia coli]|nr:phosphoserine phosphatase SerB [Escherichia coli]